MNPRKNPAGHNDLVLVFNPTPPSQFHPQNTRKTRRQTTQGTFSLPASLCYHLPPPTPIPTPSLSTEPFPTSAPASAPAPAALLPSTRGPLVAPSTAAPVTVFSILPTLTAATGSTVCDDFVGVLSTVMITFTSTVVVMMVVVVVMTPPAAAVVAASAAAAAAAAPTVVLSLPSPSPHRVPGPAAATPLTAAAVVVLATSPYSLFAPVAAATTIIPSPPSIAVFPSALMSSTTAAAIIPCFRCPIGAATPLRVCGPRLPPVLPAAATALVVSRRGVTVSAAPLVRRHRRRRRNSYRYCRRPVGGIPPLALAMLTSGGDGATQAARTSVAATVVAVIVAAMCFIAPLLLLLLLLLCGFATLPAGKLLPPLGPALVLGPERSRLGSTRTCAWGGVRGGRGGGILNRCFPRVFLIITTTFHCLFLLSKERHLTHIWLVFGGGGLRGDQLDRSSYMGNKA